VLHARSHNSLSLYRKDKIWKSESNGNQMEQNKEVRECVLACIPKARQIKAMEQMEICNEIN
jgi:hypothetical protein